MARTSPKLPLKARYPAGVPRANLPQDSPEWCYMTLDYAKVLYGSYKTSLEQWDKILGEIETARVYERVPEGHPYGSLDALLKVEIGVNKEQSRKNIVAAETKQGERVDLPDSCKLSQSDRAKENNVGRDTQQKLDKLASNRPDLLERVRAGELTAHGASVEAGFSKAPIIVPRDPIEASVRLLKHFSGDALTTLLTELASHAGYDLTPRG